MSELFKALQKLEEQNTPDIPTLPPVSSSGGGKSSRAIPYLKSFILIGIALAAAGICLAYLWFQPDLPLLISKVQRTSSSLQTSKVSTEHSAATPSNTVGVVQPIQPEIGKEYVHKEITKVNLEEPEKVIGVEPKRILIDTNIGIIDTEESLIQISGKQDQDIPPNKEEGFSEARKYVSTVNDEEVQQQHRQVAKKRLMYQAEKLRIQGDLSRALPLLKEAWEKEHDPDLGNNIAAILIGYEQYDEAEQYLRKALKLAPEDKDLLFNLEIVTQGKKQKIN
jgi:hypothetical protein